MADAVVIDLMRRLTDASLTQVRAGVSNIWSRLDDLSDEAGQAAIAQVVPLVGGAQLTVANLHATYLSQVVGFVLNTPEVATLLAEAQWNRSPLIHARKLMAQGAEMDVALSDAAARAAQVHTGDVLRARGDALDALSTGVEEVRPVRFAKVPLPDACEWCRLVSSQLYRASNKLPVHLNDRCGVNAVTPAEAGAYTNASTVFSDNARYRWRSRVQSREVADVQRRTAQRARELVDAATAQMTAYPQAA